MYAHNFLEERNDDAVDFFVKRNCKNVKFMSHNE
jgi:hypothetical protein